MSTGIKNQNGMSLVGVTVAAAVGLIVMMGMTDMMTTLYSSQRAIQSKDANRELAQSINQILLDQTACGKSFGTASGAALGTYTSITDTHSATAIKDKAGNPKFDTITPSYMNGLVKFTNFEITNFDPATNQADLNIKTSKVGSKVGGDQMLTTVKLILNVDATTHNIIDCKSIGLVGGGGSSYWAPGTTAGDIQYSGGNVGIGTISPRGPLEVSASSSSAMIISNSVAGTIASPQYVRTDFADPNYGTAGPLARIEVKSAASQSTMNIQMKNISSNLLETFLQIDRSGQFLMGSSTTPPATALYLTGGLALGPSGADTSTTCANPYGTVRYNRTGDVIQYCAKNGKWRTIQKKETIIITAGGLNLFGGFIGSVSALDISNTIFPAPQQITDFSCTTQGIPVPGLSVANSTGRRCLNFSFVVPNSFSLCAVKGSINGTVSTDAQIEVLSVFCPEVANSGSRIGVFSLLPTWATGNYYAYAKCIYECTLI